MGNLVISQETFGQVGEFCRHSQRSAQGLRISAQRCDVLHPLPGLRNGEGRRAIAESQSFMEREHLSVFTAFFLADIHPGDAEFHASLAHADDDIARALKEHLNPRQGGDKGFVLAWVEADHRQAGGAQAFQRAFFQATFEGERKANRTGHSQHLKEHPWTGEVMEFCPKGLIQQLTFSDLQ